MSRPAPSPPGDGVDAIKGRTTWITGRLLDGDVLLADAEAVFLRLLPSRP